MGDQVKVDSLKVLDSLTPHKQRKLAEEALALTLDHVLYPVDGSEPMKLHEVLAKTNPGEHHTVTDEMKHKVAWDETDGLGKKQVVKRYIELHHEFHVSDPLDLDDFKSSFLRQNKT